MKTERFWFYVGLFILALAWAPFIVGFLAVINALNLCRAYIGFNYLLWKRPAPTILGVLLVGFFAISFWPERESKTEPYWQLVPVRDGRWMEFRLIEPGEEWRQERELLR